MSFCLRKHKYSVTLRGFGDLLGVPSEGLEFYSKDHHWSSLPPQFDKERINSLVSTQPLKNGLLGSMLKFPHDQRYKIIDSNLYVKGGNHSHVQTSESAFLWCLEKRHQVNLAFFIASRMNGLTSETRRHLPYGLLLTNLFINLKLKNRGTGKPPKKHPINATTIERMEKSMSKKAVVEDYEDDIYRDIDNYAFQARTDASGSGANQEEGYILEEFPPQSPERDEHNFQRETDYELYQRQRRMEKKQNVILGALGFILKSFTCNRKRPRD